MSQQDLTDDEFACLVYRSCGVSPTSGVFGANPTAHTSTCRFCLGTYQVSVR